MNRKATHQNFLLRVLVEKFVLIKKLLVILYTKVPCVIITLHMYIPTGSKANPLLFSTIKYLHIISHCHLIITYTSDNYEFLYATLKLMYCSPLLYVTKETCKFKTLHLNCDFIRNLLATYVKGSLNYQCN